MPIKSFQKSKLGGFVQSPVRARNRAGLRLFLFWSYDKTTGDTDEDPIPTKIWAYQSKKPKHLGKDHVSQEVEWEETPESVVDDFGDPYDLTELDYFEGIIRLTGYKFGEDTEFTVAEADALYPIGTAPNPSLPVIQITPGEFEEGFGWEGDLYVAELPEEDYKDPQYQPQAGFSQSTSDCEGYDENSELPESEQIGIHIVLVSSDPSIENPPEGEIETIEEAGGNPPSDDWLTRDTRPKDKTYSYYRAEITARYLLGLQCNTHKCHRGLGGGGQWILGSSESGFYGLCYHYDFDSYICGCGGDPTAFNKGWCTWNASSVFSTFVKVHCGAAASAANAVKTTSETEITCIPNLKRNCLSPGPIGELELVSSSSTPVFFNSMIDFNFTSDYQRVFYGWFETEEEAEAAYEAIKSTVEAELQALIDSEDSTVSSAIASNLHPVADEFYRGHFSPENSASCSQNINNYPIFTSCATTT